MHAINREVKKRICDELTSLALQREREGVAVRVFLTHVTHRPHLRISREIFVRYGTGLEGRILPIAHIITNKNECEMMKEFNNLSTIPV